MDNNQTLDLNLQQISKYNPDLKYKFLRSEVRNNSISIVKTLLQEDNLLYKNVHLHNNYGAVAEAKEIFEQIQNNKTSIIILYGIGFGYLFSEVVKKAKGTVLLYEPNIDILYTTLKNIDFSKELSQQNVFVFSDFNLLKQAYIQNFKYKSDTQITFLPSYNNLFGQDIINFANDLNLIMYSCVATNNFVKNRMFTSIKSVLNNIDLLVKEPVLQDYKDIYKGKTAIIISDEQGLEKNIEIIKKYKQNAVIFSNVQAIETLLTNHIVPDITGIPVIEEQISQLENLNLSDINVIIEPLTDRSIHNLNFKNIISYPSQNLLPNIIWTTLSNINATPYYSGETILYTLLQTAQILGFRDIIVIGQVLLSEIEYFEDFAKKYDFINLYNIDTNVAKINGFKQDTLENIMKSKPPVERITLKNKDSINVSNVIKNINNEIHNADEILRLLKTASTLISNADKEFDETEKFTENFINYFKQILMIYADLKEIYASKNRLFLYLQQSYSMDLEYELKQGQQNDSIPKVYDLLKNYFSSLISNLTELKTILIKKAGELNEMLNTKS